MSVRLCCSGQFGNGEAIGGVAVAGAIVAVGIVVVQAVWLIPKLDVRVAATIAGTPLDKSHLHTVFAVLEAVKAVGLVAVGLVA